MINITNLGIKSTVILRDISHEGIFHESFEIFLVMLWEKCFSENEPNPDTLKNLPKNWGNFKDLYVLI